MANNSDFSEFLKSKEASLIEFRRSLHQKPELSFKEVETTNTIASYLEAEGLTVKRFPKTTGLQVDLKSGSGSNKPLILIRGDIDALPIQDLKTCAYKSKNDGVMHACGHDVHSSVVVGTLLALNNVKANLDFNIRAIFQPAEELGIGAYAMIEQGVMEGVNYALSLHVDPTVELGKAAIKAGPVNAAVIEFAVTLKGKTAHVARIHQGVDTIGPACKFVNNCYSHIAKKIDPRDPHILYFGVIKSGVASNIVSDECNLVATIRAFNSDVAVVVLEEVKKIGQALSHSTGVSFELKEQVNLKAVVNDKKVADFLYQGAESVIGRENIITDLPTSMGGEDFGAIMSLVPGAMMRLGVKPENGLAHGLHTAEFDVPEASISIGSNILTNTILKISKA